MNEGEGATFRELKASEEALDKRMRAIELEQASQRAGLMHLPEDVRRLTDAVNAMASRAAAPVADPNVLAMHNAADAMRQAVQALANRQTPTQEVLHALAQSKAMRNGSVWPWFIAGVAVAVAARIVWQQLTGS